MRHFNLPPPDDAVPPLCAMHPQVIMHVDARHAANATPSSEDQPFSPQHSPLSVFALWGAAWFSPMADVLLQGGPSEAPQAPVASYLLLNACIMWLRWPSVVNPQRPGHLAAGLQGAAQQVLTRLVRVVYICVAPPPSCRWRQGRRPTPPTGRPTLTLSRRWWACGVGRYHCPWRHCFRSCSKGQTHRYVGQKERGERDHGCTTVDTPMHMMRIK